MMSWGPDDGKSILKYKQKDNHQESHVRDRVDKERSTSQAGMGTQKCTFMNANCSPQANSCLSPADTHKSLRL